MIEHNKNFYSLEELKRTKDSLEGYLDNEEVYYFVGVIRYGCDEIERLKKENKELEEIIGIRECQLEEMQQQKTDYTQVNILEMKLDKLHSIIKEAREYIKENVNQYTQPKKYDELIGILDKVKENK